MSQQKDYIVKNKKAFFDYDIIDSWEWWIELLWHEVKSIRQWQVNLKGSYISIISWELYVKNMHVSVWKALPNTSHVDPLRERKLYLKKKDIEHLIWKVKEAGQSIVPLKIYLKGSLIKVQVALVKWKKLYQKKESLKKKTIDKDIRRAMSKTY